MKYLEDECDKILNDAPSYAFAFGVLRERYVAQCAKASAAPDFANAARAMKSAWDSGDTDALDMAMDGLMKVLARAEGRA